MSRRTSYVALKCEKHAITVLRYMFGSVYEYFAKLNLNCMKIKISDLPTYIVYGFVFFFQFKCALIMKKFY